MSDTDQDKIRECEAMRDLAEKDESYNRRCSIGGEKVFYVADTKARIPGHCYSEAGVREATNISGCCEYHFDEMFPADDEEDDKNG